MVRYFISRVGASSVQRDGESVLEYDKKRLLAKAIGGDRTMEAIVTAKNANFEARFSNYLLEHDDPVRSLACSVDVRLERLEDVVHVVVLE